MPLINPPAEYSTLTARYLGHKRKHSRASASLLEGVAMLGEFCKRYRIVGSGVHDHDTGPLDSEGYHFPPLRSAPARIVGLSPYI